MRCAQSLQGGQLVLGQQCPLCLLDAGLTVASSHGVYLYRGQMVDALPESLQADWKNYVDLCYYLRNEISFDD